MKRIIFILIFLFSVLIADNQTFEIGVLKNPKSNMAESKYVELEKIMEIGGDLGDGYYLFNPFSLIADMQGNLYVYDNLQAKIIKFDNNYRVVKSFGKTGQGPGEFSGTGTMHPVFLKIHHNKYLYAYDRRVKNILVFTLNGHFLKNIKILNYNFRKPLANVKGDVIDFKIKNGNLYIIKNNSQSIVLNNVGKYFNYIFSRPYHSNTDIRDLFFHSTFVRSNGKEMFDFFFFGSSRFVSVIKGKIIRDIKIFPKNALYSYKIEIKELLKKDKNVFKKMFFNMIENKDKKNTLILQYGIESKSNRNLLYAINLKTKFVKVLFLKNTKKGFDSFELKLNGRYYALNGNKINLYRERKDD